VTKPRETSADSTRAQIIRAASRQFATNSYSSVNLDEILADAKVTRGALYFHFRSKHALAEAILDERARMTRSALVELINRRMSGLETIVDMVYLVGAQEFGTELGRAGLNLMDCLGRIEGVQSRRLNEWVTAMAAVVERAAEEGDINADLDAEDVARLIIAVYAGTRLTTDMADARYDLRRESSSSSQFLHHMAKNWNLVLPAIANPERLGYLNEFIRRRTAHALREWKQTEAPSS